LKNAGQGKVCRFAAGWRILLRERDLTGFLERARNRRRLLAIRTGILVDFRIRLFSRRVQALQQNLRIAPAPAGWDYWGYSTK
jgi:hypothetical protein